MTKDEIKEETQIVKAKFMETFANNLGRIRSERELSQEKLADMAGISLSVVSNYENKKKLASALYAKKLATALDVSIDELCGESADTRYIKKLEDNPIQAILTVIRLFRFHIQLTDNGDIILSMPHDEAGYSSTEIKKFIKEYMVVQEFKDVNSNDSGVEMAGKLLEHLAEKYKHIPDFPDYIMPEHILKKQRSKKSEK
ncbi:MAG: helix-turn-helix domain-containing protein [Ruminococcus sp.]|nr:helix-turn-helix domain-containing protein [Ruminococcus sp.]